MTTDKKKHFTQADCLWGKFFINIWIILGFSLNYFLNIFSTEKQTVLINMLIIIIVGLLLPLHYNCSVCQNTEWECVFWASISNTLPLFLFFDWFRTWSEQLVSSRESWTVCRLRCRSWSSGLSWIKRHWRKPHGHWNREQNAVRTLQDISALSWPKW